MILFFLLGFIFNATDKKSSNLQKTSLHESFTAFDQTIPQSPFGLRVDARTLTKDDFRQYFDGKYPVILTNVFDVNNELWTNELMSSLGDNEIEYDVRHSFDGSIESYEATLNEFISSLPENSDHDENMYLMNEDLLSKETKLLDFLKSASSLFGDDLFDHFPEKIRPYQALIVGGIGARSFLHCDPYEWMGINYLFEGRKLWTFLSPDVSSSLFNARRNAPDAWGAYNISAGWVSDVDLYRHRQSFVLGALANSQLNKVAGKNAGSGGGLEKIVSSSLNSKWLRSAIGSTSGKKGKVGEGVTDTASHIEKNLGVPIFMSGVDDVDYCRDPRLAAGAIQFVQEEGDLVLIPPRFWHQVYHLEPSIAVASQYMNEVGKDTTFKHILKWCSRSSEATRTEGNEQTLDPNLPEDFASLTDKEQVLSVIKAGLRLQHGRIKGSALMKKLQSNTKSTIEEFEE